MLLFLACMPEVGLISIKEPDSHEETGNIIIDTSDTALIEETGETVQIQGTVGLVQHSFEQIACPSCFWVQNSMNTSFLMTIHEKTNSIHKMNFPDVNTCTTSVIDNSQIVNPVAIGQVATITGPSVVFNAYQGSGEYSWSYSTNDQNNIMYDMDSDMTVQLSDNTNFIYHTIYGFNDIQPQDLRLVSADYLAIIQKNNAFFTWDPIGIGQTLFNIKMEMYSWDGSVYLGEVSCTSSDTGEMLIPSQFLTQYPTNGLVAVYMTRFMQQRVPYEGLSGYVDVFNTWTFVGTGHLE